MSISLLRLPVVLARTGLSRSTVYARIAEGTFPPPIALGPRAVAWPDSVIDAWIAERIDQGNGTGRRAVLAKLEDA